MRVECLRQTFQRSRDSDLLIKFRLSSTNIKMGSPFLEIELSADDKLPLSSIPVYPTSSEHSGWLNNCFGDQYEHTEDKGLKCCRLNWERLIFSNAASSGAHLNPLMFS